MYLCRPEDSIFTHISEKTRQDGAQAFVYKQWDSNLIVIHKLTSKDPMLGYAMKQGQPIVNFPGKFKSISGSQGFALKGADLGKV